MSVGLARLVRPGACVAVLLFAGSAGAQDLFELEAFDYDTTAPGAYEVELHTNGVSRGGVRMESAAAAHHPVHMSVEGGERRVRA
jgi:hypothetical protein